MIVGAILTTIYAEKPQKGVYLMPDYSLTPREKLRFTLFRIGGKLILIGAITSIPYYIHYLKYSL